MSITYFVCVTKQCFTVRLENVVQLIKMVKYREYLVNHFLQTVSTKCVERDNYFWLLYLFGSVIVIKKLRNSFAFPT